MERRQPQGKDRLETIHKCEWSASDGMIFGIKPSGIPMLMFAFWILCLSATAG